MAEIYQHVPHPHVALRSTKGPAKTVDQRRLNHPNPVIRLNARVGLRITIVVGTMWCAYMFTLIALISAPSAFKSGNTTIIIAWVSSNFLQLILLPIIIVGQNIQAKAADQRSEDTYNDADAILHEALQIQQHLQAQDAELEKILGMVRGAASS
ncbi:MAG TPA: hypothetical protein VNF71_08615 [Acidimicrobiales bacterium]|nr:hypothetical protein [Acidimicrobiales bacterium]